MNLVYSFFRKKALVFLGALAPWWQKIGGKN